MIDAHVLLVRHRIALVGLALLDVLKDRFRVTVHLELGTAAIETFCGVAVITVVRKLLREHKRLTRWVRRVWHIRSYATEHWLAWLVGPKIVRPIRSACEFEGVLARPALPEKSEALDDQLDDVAEDAGYTCDGGGAN